MELIKENAINIKAMTGVNCTVGQRYVDYDENNNLITDITITNKRKWIHKGKDHGWQMQYKCNICGFDCLDCYIKGIHKDEHWTQAGYLKSKHTGCSCCSNKIVKVGINSIADTHPELIKLFYNQKDAYKYSFGSNLKTDFLCPNCGEIIYNRIINQISKTGRVPCQKCSDNFSYGNRFIYNLLSQLKIKFISEKTFDWCKYTTFNGKENVKKIYDFYIPQYNAIIEVHGHQHYRDEGFFNYHYNDVHENDVFKENLAKENKIKYYIVLDCQKSNIPYFKNSIMSSILPSLLNFTEDDINWCDCACNSARSTIKELADYYNQGIRSRNELSQKLNIKPRLVKKYVRQAYEANLLQNYDPYEETCKTRFKPKIIQLIQDNIVKYELTSEELFHKSKDLFDKQWSRSYITEHARNNKMLGAFLLCYKEV